VCFCVQQHLPRDSKVSLGMARILDRTRYSPLPAAIGRGGGGVFFVGDTFTAQLASTCRWATSSGAGWTMTRLGVALRRRRLAG